MRTLGPPSCLSRNGVALGVAQLSGCGRATHSANVSPAAIGAPQNPFAPNRVQVSPPTHVDTGHGIDTTVVYSLSDGQDHGELRWHDNGDPK